MVSAWPATLPGVLLTAAALLLLLLLESVGGSCFNRYDRGENSCDAMLAAGFTCATDFCHADDTPDETDGAAAPTAACTYAGFCDLSCHFCMTDDSPPPPLSSADCLDAVPFELRGDYPNCTAMVEARGCDGMVRRGAQGENAGIAHDYQATSEQISVRVGSLCRQTCLSCCTDAWAVESGQPNFCSMQIAGGEYSCATHFCHESSCKQTYPEFAGKCDATCHLCAARADPGEAVVGTTSAPVTHQAVSQVCTSCMLDTVRRLAALRSRYAMGSNGEADESIALLETLVAENAVRGTVSMVRQRFTGLDPRLSLANLIVRMDGNSANTNSSIIIGGHFDSTNHRPGPTADQTKPAPGADDNGSGGSKSWFVTIRKL